MSKPSSDRLLAIFDASMTDKAEPRYLTIGGYVATEITWRDLWPNWQETLNKWKIDQFSTATILSGPAARRLGAPCLADFRNLISSSQLHAVSASLNVDDWNSLPSDPRTRGIYPRAYHFCFHMLMNLLVTQQNVRNFGDLGPMKVILDTDEEGDRDALEYLRVQFASQTETFSEIEFSRISRCSEIQIADNCAGAIRKFHVAGGMETFMSEPLNRLNINGAKYSTSTVWSLNELIGAAEATASIS